MSVFAIVIAALIKMVILLGFAISLAAVLTWMERRQSAMMQDRIGPERANLWPARPGSKLGRLRLWGLIHPLADALKLAMKEDFVPSRAHRVLYGLAPVFTLVPVLLVFAVIPFGPPVCLDHLRALAPDPTACTNVHFLQVAHVDVGLLFVFAIASLGVYGAALAGWASNSAYSLLGGMRATAQMFSYEITMGMTLMGAFLVYGTLEPMALVQKQSTVGQWGIVMQPLGFILFFVAAIAETKRAPFDLPEGESEIIGYFTEYSGARFMAFYLGEFVEIVFAGCMITTVFLGGWQLPGLLDDGLHWFGHWAMPHWSVVVLRVAAFMLKVFVLCFLQLAIRWTVPRMRYDQLMRLGWKGLLPASLINVVITAVVVLWSQAAAVVR
jgi:NADH-quinone oxidoreductase subunit H